MRESIWFNIVPFAYLTHDIYKGGQRKLPLVHTLDCSPLDLPLELS